MDARTWSTLASYDTPFLAQLVTDHLDDLGIESRVLSDSAHGNLPEISFVTGGYRVQVPAEDEQAARDALATLPEDATTSVDVGEFDDHGGARPSTGPGGEARDVRSFRRITQLVGLLILAAVAVMVAANAGLIGGPP
jgi:hypothetical protein